MDAGYRISRDPYIDVGVGSLFRGLFRFAMPLLKHGAKAVGRQALQTGIQVAGDMLENRPVKESIKA